MSIRLKKVEWHNGSDFSSAMILGIPYGVKKRNGMWLVLFGGFVEPREDRNFYDRDAAKSACEQHALERIREAVEESSRPERDAIMEAVARARISWHSRGGKIRKQITVVIPVTDSNEIDVDLLRERNAKIDRLPKPPKEGEHG